MAESKKMNKYDQNKQSYLFIIKQSDHSDSMLIG